ncbi:MAG TPA: AAC(3)-I family aminoglycoside N-acetyltransferase [Polyangia bacterium]|nr:AAC(3)-I family aminoglycoside N-acetyltransferase [Polyangia bacterium]
MAYTFKQITAAEIPLARALLALFGEAFAEPDTYGGRPPGDDYLAKLLGKSHVVALVALDDGGAVAGGLVAYELEKLEQARSELYIYDLAVAEAHRRRGVATGLIRALGKLAAARGAWVMYVQADRTDPPAIRLYESLGTREDVHHFDIPVG